MKHPASPLVKTEWPALVLIAVSVIAAFYFYAHFPAQVPTHWNFNGEVDGYSGRAFGAWFGPVMLLGLYLLFFLVPYIDPKHGHYAGFRDSYHGIKNLIVGFMFVVYMLAGFAGLGYDIPVGGIIPILVGLLFVGLGYYIKSVKQNWAMGVRTPWTMESAVVWTKTNQLMARLMMLAGVLIAICAFPFEEMAKAVIFIAAIVMVAVVPIVYSYFAYQKEQKQGR